MLHIEISKTKKSLNIKHRLVIDQNNLEHRLVKKRVNLWEISKFNEM